MKAKGADFSARAKIRKLVFEGYEAEEISDIILVDLDCVKGFVKIYAKELPEVAEEKAKPAKKKVKGK